MSRSDDITNLFRRFGGEPSDYRELGRDNGAARARDRWPLLAAIDGGAAGSPAPSVSAHGTSENMPPQPVPQIFERPLEPQRSLPTAAPVAPAPSVSRPPVSLGELAMRSEAKQAPRVEPVLINTSAPLLAPAAAGFDSDLTSIFERLRGEVAKEVTAPRPPSSRESLLQRLLRS